MFVMIRKPRGITQFMGEDEMPILPVNTPLIPVNSNLIRPTNLSVRHDGGRQNITRIVKVEDILQWTPFWTRCNAKHCGKLDLMRDGKVKEGRCACYSAASKKGIPMLAMDLKMTTNMKETFVVRDYTSQDFLESFVFKNELGPGIKLTHFQDPHFNGAMKDALEDLFEYVDYWHVDMWVKPGYIDDAAAERPVGANAFNAPPPRRVRSGRFTYHIIRMIPANPDAIDRELMESFKIDLNDYTGAPPAAAPGAPGGGPPGAPGGGPPGAPGAGGGPPGAPGGDGGGQDQGRGGEGPRGAPGGGRGGGGGPRGAPGGGGGGGANKRSRRSVAV